MESYNWSIALYGAESCALRKVNQKYLENFEMWCWLRRKISWTDRVRNEVLQRVKEESNILHITTWKKVTEFVTPSIRTAF
jgi:hypothetical protein